MLKTHDMGAPMKRTAALLALLLLPAAAQAQFFVEGTFGGAKADLREFENLGLATDDAAGTWSLGGGYMFNRFLGVEAGYRAFGDFEVDSTRSDAKGVQVGPLFETFAERFRLNARIGVFSWKSENTFTGKDDGLDAYVGLGAAYAMTEKAFFGLSWTRYRLDEVNVDAFDIRLKYSF
jgi:OOP family OmpA-OmpF porin